MFRRLYTSSFKLATSAILPKTRQLTRTCQRAFSREQLEIANDKRIKLLKAMSQTTDIVKENYEPRESMAEFFKERGYEILESPNKDFVELRRHVGKMLVQVCFEAKVPRVHEDDFTNQEKKYSPIEYEREEEEDSDEEDSDDENTEASRKYNEEDKYKFTTYVTQPNGKTLVFECFSFDLQIQVENIAVIDNVEEYKHRLKEEKFDTYLADVHLLNEILQSSVSDYLERFGVDRHLMYWMANFCVDKEQRLWIDFLDETQKFMENPIRKYVE